MSRWILRALRRLVGWGFRRFTPRRHNPLTARDFPPPSTGDRPLIVLVHGYQGRPAEFATLYDRLASAFAGRADLLVPTTLTRDMGEDPCDCADELRALLDSHAGRPLLLVGHSVGGLIVRCFLHRTTAEVRAVVLLGTPNGGVAAWNLLPIHWMRSRGFAERFNAKYPLPPVPTLLCAGIGGRNRLEAFPNDGVISLHSVLALAGPQVETQGYPLDHWQLLRDPAVLDDVVAFLLQRL